MKKNSSQDYINNTYNKIQVLSYSHQIKVGKNKRNYYNVLCLNCGKTSTVREDRLTNKVKNSHCKECQHSAAVIGSKNAASHERVYKNLFTNYRYSAKIRNYDFNLDYEEFKSIISRNCHYCNSEPIESLKSKSINKSNIIVKHNGIDRVNNNQGYSPLNVLPCCTICNIMKRNLEYEDFINHITKIYNNSK